MNRLKGMLRRGYTLIELLVVIVIIGVLSAVAASVYLHVQQNSADQLPKQHLLTAWRAAQQAALDNVSTTGADVSKEDTYPSPTSSLLSQISTEEPTLKIATATSTAQVTDSNDVYVDTNRSNTDTTVLYAVTTDKRVWEMIAHVGDQVPVMHSLLSLSTVAPVSDYNPTISGIAAQGGTLTADPGAWASDTAPVYTYQWRRCDVNGANCTNISGAISQTYSPVAADAGKTLRVVVTATNTHGAASATSSQTKSVVAVANPGPLNAVQPSISGLAQELQTLTAKPGNWTGSPPITLAYQWQRCDSSGNNCVNISGATNLTYKVVTADVGSTLRFKVTATDSQGTNPASSSQTAVVTPAPPQNTALPVISGTAQDQQTLTTSNGTWLGANLTYTYQWRRCDSAGANCSNISGATSSSYLLTGADIGATIRVVVTASNITGTTPATSSQTATVVAAPPSETAAPQISGTIRVGNTLTSTTGSWAGTTPISYSYQWRRCDSAGANCVNLSGATSQTYTLVGADAASTVRVVVTATNVAGTTSATSNQTVVVPPGAGTASISGAPVVGQTLTATASGWSGVTTWTYQWRSCDASGSNCTDMSGQTSQTYSPVAGDIGNTLRVVITGTNSGGSASATSPQTSAVSRGVPAGTVVAFTGSTVPANWAIANGSCGYASTTSPDLYAAIGTTYGGTSSNFCLPDLRGKFALGKTASGTGSTLGASGGNALGSSTSVNLPAQTFNFSWTDSPANPPFAAHSHTWSDPSGSANVINNGSYAGWSPPPTVNETAATESGSVTAKSLSYSWSDTPTASVTNQTPPYQVVNYLIALTTGANAPCGAVWGFGGSSLPAGTQKADGSAASGTLSCESASFSGNTPDLRGRFAVGQAASGVASTLAATGGSLASGESATLPNQQTTILPPAYSVNLTISSPAHAFSYGNVHSGEGGCCYTNNPWAQDTNGMNNNGSIVAANSGTQWNNAHNAGGDNGGAVSSSAYQLDVTSNAVGGQTVTSSTVTNPFLTVNQLLYNVSGYAPDAGIITPFAGATAPTGWLLADGTCGLSTTGSYASLFSAIGYTYGGSAGSFCVPDLRGKIAAGLGSSAPTNTLGAAGGALDVAPTATFAGFTPSFSVPAHSLSWNIPAHNHYDVMNNAGWVTCCDMTSGSGSTVGYSPGGWNYTSANGGQVVTSSGSTPTVSASNPYSGQTVTLPPVDPPYVALNYIIKY